MKRSFDRSKILPAAVTLGSVFTLTSVLTACNSVEEKASSPSAEDMQPTQIPKIASTDTNVIYIILDDIGFSDVGAYGSEIKTPNIDALASSGLRYNNFNALPFSSATRASLLSGRENNSVGMGHVANVSLEGVPNLQGHVSEHAGLISEILKEYDFNTYGLGKWHIAPVNTISAAGPYNDWPMQRGFDRFYGFMDGETDQYKPQLVSGNEFLKAPDIDGYTLNEDLITHANQFLTDHVSNFPKKPFFMNYAFGTGHSPHQVPARYSDVYKGAYDAGWDVIREQRFEKQKQLGIIPVDTQLATWDETVKPWDTLSADQKKLYTRFMEVYAGYITQADEEIGKLISHLKELGIYDNTMIVLLAGDNGATPDGGPEGTDSFINAMAGGRIASSEDLMPKYDLIGTAEMQAVYPKGWAQVSNTPFSGYKGEMALGALRNGLIISWPNGIKAQGEVRDHYVHVADITPTVLELLNISPPKMLKGVAQMPMYGQSIAATFDTSEAAEVRSSAFYYKVGSRSIYSDGWRAVSDHINGQPFEDDLWRLYHVSEDFSESTDLAARNPEKLAELKDLFMAQAEQTNILPMRELTARDLTYIRPGSAQDRMVYKYYPGASFVNVQAAPAIAINGYDITAPVTMHSVDDEGVLIAMGDDMGGYSMYVEDQHLVFVFNRFGVPTKVVSKAKLPLGDSLLEVVVNKVNPVVGIVTLKVNGNEIGGGKVMTTFQPTLEGLSIGEDALTAVDPSYKDKNGFPFTGEYKYVQVEMIPFRPQGAGAPAAH